MIGLVWFLAAAIAGGDGPEISRSRGSSRGLVVLWPRLVPETDDPVLRDLADRMKNRLYAAAAEVVPYRRVDVRPEPERVCPRDGCRAPAVSVMIGHQEGGCVVVGLLQPPGPTPPVAWSVSGEVELIEPLAFRTPPENAVVVREFTPCAYAEAGFEAEKVVAALRAMTEQRSPSRALTPLTPPPPADE
ncbi:MAG: hypothetical protein AAF602_02070 [Myxococcota bacterium]